MFWSNSNRFSKEIGLLTCKRNRKSAWKFSFIWMPKLCPFYWICEPVSFFNLLLGMNCSICKKRKIKKKKTGISVECPQGHQFSHFPSLLNSDLFLKSVCFPSNNEIRRRTIEQPPYVFLVIILLAFMISNMRVRYHSNGFSYLFFLLQVTTRILGSNDRTRWYIQIWKISFGSEWKGDNFKIYHPYFRTCWERFEVN